MKYQIIGKNISVTEGISRALTKKLSKMDKYFLINDDVECRVVCFCLCADKMFMLLGNKKALG